MESERAGGVEGREGGCGTLANLAIVCFDGVVCAIGSSIERCDASKLSGGDSTCCAVELKYRARLGRRKVGGSAEDGMRMSSRERLAVLSSSLKLGGHFCAIISLTKYIAMLLLVKLGERNLDD